MNGIIALKKLAFIVSSGAMFNGFKRHKLLSSLAAIFALASGLALISGTLKQKPGDVNIQITNIIQPDNPNIGENNIVRAEKDKRPAPILKKPTRGISALQNEQVVIYDEPVNEPTIKIIRSPDESKASIVGGDFKEPTY